MRTGSILGGGLMLAGSAAALDPLPEHVDVVPSYSGGAWNWVIKTDTGDLQPETIFLPVRDAAFPAGERYARPTGSQWDFLAIDAAMPVWILPQSDNGHTWPGLENSQSGAFGSYVESDPRAAGVAQAWIRVSLDSFQGPGEFSLFQIQSGAPVIWMATSDGIDASDAFYFASLGHSHMNWAFSAKGMYRLQMSASAYLGPGATNPTPAGESVGLHVAVGARAEWRASRFPVETVMDEAVAGPDADPDGDGLANLLEYGFGSDPLDPGKANPETSGIAGPEFIRIADGVSIFPAFRFFRRIHEDADVTYSVEWSDGLDGGWEAGGIETSVENFGDRWERVTVRDTRAVSGSRFGRVRVEIPTM
jgi:surface-anchored protein